MSTIDTNWKSRGVHRKRAKNIRFAMFLYLKSEYEIPDFRRYRRLYRFTYINH